MTLIPNFSKGVFFFNFVAQNLFKPQLEVGE